MRLRRIVLPVIVGVVLLGGLTAVQDTVFRERIEDKLTDNAAAALSEAGIDDVEVSFTGRDGEVTAKTEAAAVEAGAGASVLSEAVVTGKLAAGTLVVAPFPLPTRTFRMLRHKERYRSRAADALIDLIKKGKS